MDLSPIHLAFDGGTLVLSGAEPERRPGPPAAPPHPRAGTSRPDARHYRMLVEHLRRHHLPYKDEARNYQAAAWSLQAGRDPFPHQTEALETWWGKGSRPA